MFANAPFSAPVGNFSAKVKHFSLSYQIRRNISDPEIDKTPPPKKFDSQ